MILLFKLYTIDIFALLAIRYRNSCVQTCIKVRRQNRSARHARRLQLSRFVPQLSTIRWRISQNVGRLATRKSGISHAQWRWLRHCPMGLLDDGTNWYHRYFALYHCTHVLFQSLNNFNFPLQSYITNHQTHFQHNVQFFINKKNIWINKNSIISSTNAKTMLRN